MSERERDYGRDASAVGQCVLRSCAEPQRTTDSDSSTRLHSTTETSLLAARCSLLSVREGSADAEAGPSSLINKLGQALQSAILRDIGIGYALALHSCLLCSTPGSTSTSAIAIDAMRVCNVQRAAPSSVKSAPFDIRHTPLQQPPTPTRTAVPRSFNGPFMKRHTLPPVPRLCTLPTLLPLATFLNNHSAILQLSKIYFILFKN